EDVYPAVAPRGRDAYRVDLLTVDEHRHHCLDGTAIEKRPFHPGHRNSMTAWSVKRPETLAIRVKVSPGDPTVRTGDLGLDRTGLELSSGQVAAPRAPVQSRQGMRPRRPPVD